MELENNMEAIELNSLLPKTMEMKQKGYRLAQICSAYVNDKYELRYSFAREYELINFSLVVNKDELVPSITDIYSCAFLYENEMKELFGVNMEFIDVDYHNKLYRINEETPFIKEDK